MFAVLNVLCEMGIVLSGMNIKSAATNWKCYLGLLQKYSLVLKERDFVPPFKLLIDEVDNNLDNVLSSVSFYIFLLMFCNTKVCYIL